ncbi:MAG: SDR family NAD(P)-dependent oxidoreductase [Oligoflexus sp.]
MSLKRKVACITGASSGIGAATAAAFAEKGCHIIAGARRKERLDRLAQEWQEMGAPSVLTLELDVRSDESVQNFQTVACQAFPKIDILVNNAGLVLGMDTIATGQSSDWQTILDTNVMGVLRICRSFIPSMIEAGSGHIMMIGSIAGHQVYEGGGPYCASKHAVKALTQTLKLELNGKGIRVTSIDPGMVETEFSIVRLGSEEKAKQVYRGLTPLVAADIADCIVFAASRPVHVNIDEMIVMPTAQAAVYKVHREP